MPDDVLATVMRTCMRTLGDSGAVATVIICVDNDGNTSLTSTVSRELYTDLFNHILDPKNLVSSGTAPADGDA